MNPVAVTPKEAGAMLQLSRQTTYKLINQGVIPAVRIPGCRGIRVPVDRLKDVINKLAAEQNEE